MTANALGIASHTRSRDEREFSAFAEQLTNIRRGPSAEYLNRLLEVPDDEYFSALVELVQAVTGAAYVFVGESWGEDWDRVRSLAHHGERGPLPAFEYDLADTPCANVLTQSVCVFPSAVADLYPKDVLLRQMNIESYVGVPLGDPTGLPLGLLVILDEHPLGPELAQSRRELLAGFRRRSESVLIHRRALRELALVQQQVDPAGGRVALGQLALAVAHALHVRAAFVAEFADVQQCRLRILAFAVDADLRPGLEYPRAGEPCNAVYESGEAFHAAGAKPEFPHSRVLAGPVAESYLGVVMHSRSGEVLGHLAILHVRPLHDKLRERPVFQLFRQRIAQELERARQEAEREQAVRRLTEMQRVEALGMLAGGIAHDFNNLLVGIMSNAELAQGSLPANSYANVRLQEVVAASEQAFADPGAHATLAAAKRRCILVVDDEPMVRNAASATLTAAGDDILTACDGVEAVDCYRKHRKHIDGVLLDLSMPKMDGLEALARLRKIDPNVRVLLCSGYIRTDPTDPELRIGAPFLPKPYRRAQLLHEIHRLLEARSAASSLEAAREESAPPAVNGGAPSGLRLRS